MQALTLSLLMVLIHICAFENQWRRCPVFCGLVGQIPNSNCSVKQLDLFNAKAIELLAQIISRPYFRFYKTHLTPNCSFWPQSEKCFGLGCSIYPCSSSDLPDNLVRNWISNLSSKSHTICEANDPLGNLDISSKTVCQQNCEVKGCNTERYVFGTPTFCDIPDDEDNPNSVFVDLQKNPERYTGYRGESSWRIWKAIYEENCCWALPRKCQSTTNSPNYIRTMSNVDNTNSRSHNIVDESCLENKIFYNIVSGFHASVNVHVCARFYFADSSNEDKWGYNLPEFTKRFGSLQTNGKGTGFLKNLYFVYLLELRSIIKAAPYLRTLQYDDGTAKCKMDGDKYTGSIKDEDIYCCKSSTFVSTECLMNKFLDYVNTLSCMFDESTMFKDKTNTPDIENVDQMCGISNDVKETFRNKFINITKILDCVECDKCRMWGRIQIKAIGTALNIIFHNASSSTTNKSLPPLTRSQVVALLNGFARCAESLQHIAKFRELSNELFHNEL